MMEDEMDWACRSHGEMRNARILLGKPETNRPLGRPKRKCEDVIKMYLTETWSEVVD
jgi:hypothetical protein